MVRPERKTVNGRKKVTVVGAGNVGATCAQELARRDYADIVLVDVKPNFAAGKALDINQAGSVLGYEPVRRRRRRVGLRGDRRLRRGRDHRRPAAQAWHEP